MENQKPEINSANMSSLSKHGARLVHVKKEVCNMIDAPANEKIPKGRLVSSSEAAQAEEDEIYHLSEKSPFFDSLPANVFSVLPRAIIPVVLRHGGKNWTVSYHGDSRRPRFGSKWKEFVIDNHLKSGDACVFELIEPVRIYPVLKVHILRGDLPPELLELMDTRGKTANAPIVID
ncbi:hypothetical protein DH2020_045501 [Rehmannia glutinosa]|uniref:TF-B3 domain-containing protein n=1 Tax=Rehmannia glutinosa TaxID=99300 RepID=A0ABR0UF35_REHGL